MRLKKILACFSLMAVALSASASVELTFEDRGVAYSALGNPYTGFTFIGSPFTYGSNAAGGIGNFVGKVDAAHPVNNVALFVDAPGASGRPTQLVINVDAGFSTLFELLFTTYESWDDTDVEVYSGLNGTGTLLASNGILPVVDQTGCATGIACKWGKVSLDLDNSIAHSVVISVPDAVFFFDNFFFGDLPATVPGGDVPEPAGTALSLAALGALALTRRRKQAGR